MTIKKLLTKIKTKLKIMETPIVAGKLKELKEAREYKIFLIKEVSKNLHQLEIELEGIEKLIEEIEKRLEEENPF